MFLPQTDGLLSVVEKVSRHAKNGALVSIESTIPMGTSKKVFELLNHRLHVVHAPHRWYALEEKEHGVNQLRVIGGVCDCCLKAGMQFYDGRTGTIYPHNSVSDVSYDNYDKISSSVTKYTYNNDLQKGNGNGNGNGLEQNSLNIPMHSVSTIEIAEITKIVENAHRYLQIAFAEELYLYCQENNMSFSELRDALNTKWNVNILEPREGIGGHCLPKDTKMFLESSKSKSKILSAAMQADTEYRKRRKAITYRSTQSSTTTDTQPERTDQVISSQ
jgi:UDP-N-acetyl-D-mannosaminuronate dehydrogenase